jgi:hypothetical protein
MVHATLRQAVAPLLHLGIVIAESQLITPTLIGDRLGLNPLR